MLGTPGHDDAGFELFALALYFECAGDQDVCDTAQLVRAAMLCRREAAVIGLETEVLAGDGDLPASILIFVLLAVKTVAGFTVFPILYGVFSGACALTSQSQFEFLLIAINLSLNL